MFFERLEREIILDKNLLYKLYWDDLLSQSAIASRLNCSIDVVRKNLYNYGIPIHKPNYNAHKQKIFLNEKQKNYLYGAMLGDGCLVKNKNGVNSNFVYTSKSYQHVKYVSEPFQNILYKEGIKLISYNDKRTQKTYNRYTFRTMTDVAFKIERDLWYPNGIKHIPNSLKLNSDICKIWYIGDGCICNNSNSHSQNIKLATQCFEKQEQEDILLPQLSDFNATLMKADVSKNGTQQYSIYIPRIKILEFLNYIGECPFSDYKYKWDCKLHLNKVSEPQMDNEIYFIKLYLLGLKCKQIAEVFNIDFNTVKKYLIKNNVYKGE